MHFSSTLSLYLLGLSTTVYAGLIQARQIGAVNQTIFDTISLYEQYAAAAYCQRQWSNSTLFGGPTSLVDCNGAVPDNCLDVEKGTTATLKVDNSGTDQGGTFYIGVDTQNKNIVVSFRGTDGARAPKDLTRIFANRNAALVPYTEFCAGCNGSPVLRTEYLFNNATIINEVQRLVNLPENKGFKIVTTGHSFGGALANIAVIELNKAFPNISIDMASYGANEVGDQTFANFVSAQDSVRGRNFRVTHLGDAIPNSLRDAGHTDYRVIFPAYSITTGNPPLFFGAPPITTSAGVQRLADDITLRTQPQPDTLGALLGNPAADLVTAGPAHGYYLNSISACF